MNKVSTKVELTFDLQNSEGLSKAEKERAFLKLAPKLTKDGILQLHCDESRSQHKNKELVIRRFFNVLVEVLRVVKVRRKTTPSKSAIEKRLNSKKKTAQKKANRGKPNID